MATFKMANLFAYLGVPGPDLLLRPFGKRAFPMLSQELLNTPAEQSLILDFSNVSVMDTSFCDETVLELALGLVLGKYGDRFLILDCPSSATIDNLEGTIARRRAKVALLVRNEERTFLVGRAALDEETPNDPIERNLAEAWQRVQASGTLTARELADQLDLEINTASMRLHKLYVLRLLARREEVTAAGRQHIYSIPS